MACKFIKKQRKYKKNTYFNVNFDHFKIIDIIFRNIKISLYQCIWKLHVMDVMTFNNF
jgi:hypothetical protein